MKITSLSALSRTCEQALLRLASEADGDRAETMSLQQWVFLLGPVPYSLQGGGKQSLIPSGTLLRESTDETNSSLLFELASIPQPQLVRS